MKEQITKINQLSFDTSNANRGTERGRQLLTESLSGLGAGRSIVCDKHGTVIGGNKTLESAQELGLEIEVVHTRGDRLVVVVRDDLNLETDSKARALAYSDNRINEIDLNWDVEEILKDIDLVSVEGLWTEDELERLQDGVDLKEFEAIAGGNADDQTNNESSETEDSSSKTDSDMVPFHCLLTQEQRERLFEAINRAKREHELETTAEALDVIAQEYLK